MVASYTRMWSYGAHPRCDTGDSSTHVTYDSGIGVRESEIVDGSIDVGVLSRIYLVAFGSLTVIVLKVSWIQHLNQGRHAIRKDPAGFWTCRFNAREDETRKNPFILPANASQVFFVEDLREPESRVVVFHEPRSRRVIGSDAHDPNSSYGKEMALETPLPHGPEAASTTLGAPRRVPPEAVQSIDLRLSIPVDDATFQDTEYEEECEVESSRSPFNLA